MKRLRFLMVVAVAVCFLAGTVSIGLAAERGSMRGVAPSATMPMTPKVPAMMTCPPGWHLKKNNTEEYKCAPNAPAPMQCPEGWKYVEALDCQGAQGLGSQILCSGCEVGCLKIPVIK